MKLWAAVLAAAAVLGALAAVVATADGGRPQVPGLPVLHGQASWARGVRAAPAGTPHGRTALVAFLGGRCAPCLAELRWIAQQLPAGERPAVVLPPESAAPAYGVARGRLLVLLVDRHGDERTGYSFPLVPSFVVRDLRTLAR